ncbi:ABC transporter substrate-binding protein [Martelella mediterranea]|uniref:Raffinose/stachyose/melibiose transport system substrate-binding protein n=1 Tax=Martelella mediterranea TaxID=293089 RepID=A0A4R3NNI6_9HYPH|nr:ABC transporter substrate-binding protein [Martelella mediterranea]TCT33061.1 raffinose/stachyose/melibiose transport system substrate-binding protein [Martelella mediterranea]
MKKYSKLMTSSALVVGAMMISSGLAQARELVWLSARPENGAIVQTVRELADAYAADHPDFSLDIQVTADRASYLTKLRTLIASGEVPDFFDTDADPFARQLADAGLMVDMAAFLDEEGLTDRFYEPAIRYQQFSDGSLYLLPLEYHLEMTWYNKAMFEKYGLSVPETLDDMLALNTSLSEDGVTPIAISGTDAWPMLRYLAMVPFRDTGNDFIRNLADGDLDTEMATKAADFFQAVSQGFQPGFISTDYVTARNMFINGEAAMYRMGTWELATFSNDALPEAMKNNVGYFYLPTTPDAVTPDNEFFGNSGIGMAAFSGSFDDEAKDFLSYLLENYSDIYVAKKQLSPLKFELKDGVTYDPLFVEIKHDADNYGEEFAKPWDTLLSPDANRVINDVAFRLATGQISSEAFVSELGRLK